MFQIDFIHYWNVCILANTAFVLVLLCLETESSSYFYSYFHSSTFICKELFIIIMLLLLLWLLLWEILVTTKDWMVKYQFKSINYI